MQLFGLADIFPPPPAVFLKELFPEIAVLYKSYYMSNTYIFLRHAETKKDPNRPAVEWVLAEDALLALQKHIDAEIFSEVEVIVTSTEEKAFATARPIIATLDDIPVLRESQFNEVKRGDAFLTDEEFLTQKKDQLTHLDRP
jgi:broad specificity phosphatase PhoE